MKLNASQSNLFFKLWPKACKAQGWDRFHGLNSAAVELKRHEFLSGLGRFACGGCGQVFHIGGKHEPPESGLCDCGGAVARTGFASLKDVDQWEDFSLVKRELLKLDDQIQGAREQVQKTIETGRKGRWVIEHDLFPCISLYADVGGVISGLSQDPKFTWKMGLMRGEPFTLGDLTDEPVVKIIRGEKREFKSQVRQLLEKLSDLLNGKSGLRAAAGHTIHDMRTLAGLACDCKECQMAGAVRLTGDAGNIERVLDPDIEPF